MDYFSSMFYFLKIKYNMVQQHFQWKIYFNLIIWNLLPQKQTFKCSLNMGLIT